MFKHLGSLRRLQQKFASTHGEFDTLVVQLKNEIESREATASKSRRRHYFYFARSTARSVNVRQQVRCAHTT